MTKKRWSIVIAGVGVLGAGAAYVLRDSGIAVETAAVTRGTMQVTVADQGRTRLRQRYVVAAPVAGRVQRLAAKEGDRVAAGDALVSISPAPADPRDLAVARSRLAAAEAKGAEAKAQVQDATAAAQQKQRDLERVTSLAKQGTVSQDALEQSRLAATTAQEQLDARRAAGRAADAEVEAARAALIGMTPGDHTGAAVTVRAPTQGRILRVLQQSARVVAAGTPLVEVGDAAGLEAIIELLSEDAVKTKPGDLVLIDQWGGDKVLEGRVRVVEPDAFTKVSALGVEEQRVNVIADIVEPPPSLGARYRIEARIVVWEGHDVLQVPTTALFQEHGTWTVFAVDKGRASRRAVKLGHQSADAAEVQDGLKEGDRVILYPSALIADGVRVK